MLFKTIDGQLMMSIHSPNSYSEELFETASFYPIEDNGNIISIDRNSGISEHLSDYVLNIVYEIYYCAVKLFYVLKEI